MTRKRTIVGVGTALSAILALSACSSDGYTDQSMQSLRYEKGASQGGKFVECMEPGKKIATNDAIYPYPSTQREDVWDTDNYHKGSFSADHPDMKLTDRNGIVVYAKMKVPFFLNTDCTPITVKGKKYKGGTLQVYHELIGKTRKAYFRKDGTYGGERSGWIWSMDNYISSSVLDYMSKEARKTTADVLYTDSNLSTTIQTGLNDQLPKLVDDGMETDLHFYLFPKNGVKIYKFTPEDEYLKLYKDRNNAKIKAQTAEENRKARVAEAKADAAVAAERAKVTQNEIKGYGGPQWYACVKSLEKDLPCYQPGGTLFINPNAPTK